MIVMRPSNGFTHNPFNKSHLRNKICMCGSGKKLKNCHGSHPYIEEKLLEQMMTILEFNAAQEKIAAEKESK